MKISAFRLSQMLPSSGGHVSTTKANSTGSSETLELIYNLYGVTSQKTPTGKLVLKMKTIRSFETAVQLTSSTSAAGEPQNTM